jgi:hypothetical protein
MDLLGVKCFSNRQNPLTHVGNDERDAAFEAICKHFDRDWLAAKAGSHRVHDLWVRRDALSTIELFTLGVSLRNLDGIDESWVKHQVQLARGNDANNQNGAFFELIGANYLHAAGQRIIPAKRNQKGFDLDAIADSGFCWRVSLKTYAESRHEIQFKTKAKAARQQAMKAMKAKGVNGQIVFAADSWPTESYWQELLALLRASLVAYDGRNQHISRRKGGFINISPLAEEPGDKFADNYCSHTFLAISPFHSNEQANYLSKLESAVANLSKHVSRGSGQSAFILLRLPPTASAAHLKAWTDGFLRQNPNGVLDGVIFLQPYVAMDTSRTFVTHYTCASISPNYMESGKPVLKMAVPVGVISSQPPQWAVQVNDRVTPLEGYYTFQRGEHYHLMRETSTGLEGNIARKAPGIATRIVWREPEGEVVLTGRWGDELSIIGG